MVDIFGETAMPSNLRFIELLRATKREGIENLIYWLVNMSDFFTAPASTKYHGAKEGGLLEHSLTVRDAGDKLLGNCDYHMPYSRSSWDIVSLLHDVCKANFYTVEMRNVKDPIIDGQQMYGWHKVPYYAIDDQYPFGHGEKSVDIIRDYIELTTEERMAIRWHMGLTDTDYSARQALNGAFSKYPLAVALHLSDMAANYFEGK